MKPWKPIVAAAALAALASAKPADAAVRVCHPSVSSEIVTGHSELEAKKKALAEWQVKAAKFGQGRDAWHLAIDKALKCFPKGNEFECIAVGQPCIIKQNPSRKPALSPEQKGQSL